MPQILPAPILFHPQQRMLVLVGEILPPYGRRSRPWWVRDQRRAMPRSRRPGDLLQGEKGPRADTQLRRRVLLCHLPMTELDLHDRAVSSTVLADWPPAEDDERLKTDIESVEIALLAYAGALRDNGEPLWMARRSRSRPADRSVDRGGGDDGKGGPKGPRRR